MPFDLGSVTPLDQVPQTHDFMPDGQPFENPLAAAEPGYENAPVSTTTAIGQLAQTGVTAQLGRQLERSELKPVEFPKLPMAAQDPSTPDAQQEAQDTQQAAQEREQAAEELPKVVAQQKADAAKRDAVLGRWANQTGAAGRIGTSIVAGLLDPLNDAAMFMPGIGEEAAMANIGRMGLSTETMLARMAARGISGASAGVAGMAPIAALQYGLAQGEGTDYSIRDAMNDLMFGAVVGAAGHAGFGALREAGIMRPDALLRERALAIPADVNADAMHAAAAQVMSGREVDVRPVADVTAPRMPEGMRGPESTLTPPPEVDTVRLYRVEAAPPESAKPGEVPQDHFTTDLAHAKESGGPVSFVDVPKDQMTNFAPSERPGEFTTNDPAVRDAAKPLVEEASKPQYVPAVMASSDIADTAQKQQAVYRNGYAQGIPQREFNAANEAIYGSKAEPAPGEPKPPAAGTAKAATAGDQALALWQAKFDAAKVAVAPEDQALIEATKANLERANSYSDGYAQAGECLTGAGI